jgi:hypothetical protein
MFDPDGRQRAWVRGHYLKFLAQTYKKARERTR